MEKTKIEDFGEKIGGAKKDLWSKRGLDVLDIIEMNEAEKDKYVKKDNIWKRPDYNTLIENGIPPLVVYYMKVVRDSLPTKPSVRTGAVTYEEKVQSYIREVGIIRDATMQLKTINDMRNLPKILAEKGLLEIVSDGNRESIRTGNSDVLDYSVLRKIRTNDSDLRQYERDIKKKKFGYSEKDKVLAGYTIVKYQKDTHSFEEKERALVIKVREGFSTSYWYISENRSEYKEDTWQEGTYYAISNGDREVKFRNIESPEKLKDMLFEDAKENEDKEVITTNRKKGFVPPQLAHIQRTGPDYRKDRVITGEDYLQEFGFRGGEFGNWLNETDRQASLNYGYEALRDLAEALEIPTEEISLKGNLSIAFGARGSGNALAHYEPLRKVINLTKMKGAGSLAHEWGHAFDDIIGGKSGNNKGLTSYSLRTSQIDSIKELMETINYRKATKEELEEQKQKKIEKSMSMADSWFNHYFKDNKMNEQQKAAKQRLREKYIEEAKELDSRSRYQFIAEGKGIESLDSMNLLHKDINGKKIPKSEWQNLARIQATLSNAYTERVLMPDVPSNYAKESEEFDKLYSKSDKGYWASDVEMFARAFACYVNDKLERESDYLVGHSECGPIPRGEEREKINKCFDSLIAEMKEKGYLKHQEYPKEKEKNQMENENDKEKITLPLEQLAEKNIWDTLYKNKENSVEVMFMNSKHEALLFASESKLYFEDMKQAKAYIDIVNLPSACEVSLTADGKTEHYGIQFQDRSNNSYNKFDYWEGENEKYTLGYAIDDEYYIAVVTSTEETRKGTYEYEFGVHPTREDVENAYINDISARDIDRHEEEYGADGYRAFPHLNDLTPEEKKEYAIAYRKDLQKKIDKQVERNVKLYNFFQYQLQELSMQPLINEWRDGSHRLKELEEQLNNFDKENISITHSEENIILHIKYKEPVEINGWKSETDTITFSTKDELQEYINGNATYDYLDNSVKKKENEIMLYAENQKTGEKIWYVIESKALDLANRLEQFAKDNDFYEYQDNVTDSESFVEETKNQLLSGNINDIVKYMNEIIEEELAGSDDAKALKDEIMAFAKENIQEQEGKESEYEISYYVNECGEFPEMGKQYNEFGDLKQAYMKYEQLATNDINHRIPNLGFHLKNKDNENDFYEGDYSVLSGYKLTDLSEYPDAFKESEEVQKNVKELISIIAERTIALSTIQKSDTSTWMKKDNSPRGCSCVSREEIKAGDQIVINNYFRLITEVDYNQLKEAEKKEPYSYTYYITQKSLDRGIYPIGEDARVENYEKEKYVEQIGGNAMGEIHSSSRLTTNQLIEYGLVASPETMEPIKESKQEKSEGKDASAKKGSMNYQIEIRTGGPEGSNMKGSASVVFDNKIKVSNIAIVENTKSGNLFVSYPSYKTSEVDSNGKAVYKSICNPITSEFYKELTDNIMAAYYTEEKKLEVRAQEGTLNIQAKAHPVSKEGSKVKALTEITMDDKFKINSVKLVENNNGHLFLSMPSCATNKKDENGKPEYVPICECTTNEERDKITEKVKESYRNQEKEKDNTR